MSNLEKYINKYRSIVDGSIEQKIGHPVWNKELPYRFNVYNSKIESEIENVGATLQIIANYPNENINEVHNYALTFTGFAEPERAGLEARKRRNVCGTYIKTINYTTQSDRTDDNIHTYTETVSGEFKSYDFDYMCRYNRYSRNNTNLLGKNISFINETFVSISDENAKWRSIHDHPDYNIYFTRSNCQVNFFTDKKNVSKYKDRPGYNNKPSDEFTYVWFAGNQSDMPVEQARSVDQIRDSGFLFHCIRTGENTMETSNHDVCQFYNHDRDVVIVWEFEPGSNKATGRALDFDVRKKDPKNIVSYELVVSSIDNDKQVKDINDIDFKNLQNYIYSCRTNLDQFGKRILPEPVLTGSYDIIPGFIFNDRYI